MTVFWDVVPCSLVEIDVSEVLTASIITIALMMEAVSTPETLVNFYHTTQHNMPEDNHLHYNILMELPLVDKVVTGSANKLAAFVSVSCQEQTVQFYLLYLFS
jgi:hypothetical protein